jgi:hypothetical protein
MNKPFEAGGNQFFVAHVYRLPVFELMEEHRYNIICPLRHPITTVKSWHDKYTKEPMEVPDDLSDMVDEVQKYCRTEWVPNLYKNIIFADKLYDINFIPIDSPRRDEYLRKFKKKFGLHLNTFWKPLNSHGVSTVDTPDELLTSTQDLINENPEFFGKFY